MRVVVLAGGISTERDVSLSSGAMIYHALRERGHQTVLLDVYLGYEGDQEGIFERGMNLIAQIDAVREEDPDLEAVKALRREDWKGFFGPGVLDICRSADGVFLALHGANGEDGRIQACFDLMGIPYTGADFTGSCIAMDKGITKDLFRAHGIPTPMGFRLRKGAEEVPSEAGGSRNEKTAAGLPDQGAAAQERVPYPRIVKACCGGSSIGVYVAGNSAEYEAAKTEAFRYGEEIIVEQYIKGREFSVGVMDGKALPVIEMAPKEGFYNYKNKYQAGTTVETCPAQIDPGKTRELQNIAEKVFRALRLKGYARMDFVMSKEGEPFCLEANTLPGMTATSLLPQEAAAAGMDFGQLCQRILELAF